MPVLDVVAPLPGPTGILITSQPSLTETNTMTTLLWWLVDCQTPSNSMALEVIGDNLPMTSSETQAQHLVLGADYVTVIADTIKGATFTMTVDFLTEDDWNTFVALRAQQKTLLLQAPYAAQWYIRFGPDVVPTVMNAAGEDGPYRQAQVTVIQQARP